MKYLLGIIFYLVFSLQISCTSEKPVEITSEFTSVNTEKCISIDLLQAEQQNIAKGAEAVFECNGAQNYKLYLIDDGTRSWYVLKKADAMTSFEEDIIYKNTPGNFPNVGVDDKVEWIIGPEKIVSGLIFDVVYQVNDEETGRFTSISRYIAVNLRGVTPVVMGLTENQEQAKKLLTTK